MLADVPYAHKPRWLQPCARGRSTSQCRCGEPTYCIAWDARSMTSTSRRHLWTSPEGRLRLGPGADCAIVASARQLPQRRPSKPASTRAVALPTGPTGFRSGPVTKARQVPTNLVWRENPHVPLSRDLSRHRSRLSRAQGRRLWGPPRRHRQPNNPPGDWSSPRGTPIAVRDVGGAGPVGLPSARVSTGGP